VLAVTAGTGLRFGELSALWVTDVDLDRGAVRVNKAWKRNGEDDATDTPGWLTRQVRAKHAFIGRSALSTREGISLAM
jgi:hypothetical protein